jgi:hypothetical protein
MKKLVLLVVLIPFFTKSKAQFTLTNSSTTSICEVRPGTDDWPLDLQRVIKQNDTSYALNFRDQQYAKVVVMSTLKFKDKGQLKYFQQALSSLAQLESGTIANFRDYTIKRADVKKNVIETVTKAPAKKDPTKKNITAKEVTRDELVKKEEIWYLLTCGDGTVTNFQQVDATKMIAAIQPL